MTTSIRPLAFLPALAAALVLVSCTGFHEIRPGQLYRDRQPAEDELLESIEEHGIRTVVMLRGLNEDTRVTRRAAWAANIDFVHLPMSARSLPSAERLRSLWQTIARAERPILFHCRAGVDRTGLAAALAVLHDTDDLEAAREQLDVIPYGHVPLFGTEAMDDVLDRYAPHHGQMPFGRWIEEVYAPEFATQCQR